MAANSPGGGGSGSTSISDELPPGVLTNVSVFTEGPTLQPFTTFVTVSILLGTVTGSNREIHLINDYCDRVNPISWAGIYEVPEGSTILMQLIGDLDPIFRLRHQRLIHTLEGQLMRYLQSATSPS